MQRSLSVICLVAALAAPAQAGLAAGDSIFNPQLNGTGQIGSTGPFYTSGVPIWLNNGNLIASLSSPINGIPGFPQFQGFVDSYLYAVSPSQLGLAYQIRLSASSADRLVRAAISPDGWSVVNVINAGADELGASTATTGAVNWSDGDPHFIGREFVTAAPFWQFRFGNIGTVLNRGQQSALIWFETNALQGQVLEGSITLQDGGAVGGARVLTIPEPLPAAAGTIGLLLTLAFRRLVR